jgi:hypothetical protein
MIKPWFHNWGKTCCCTHQTYSWGFQLAGHLLHQLHANKFFGTIHHRAIKRNQSSSSIFKHLLESIDVVLSVICLSQNTVNCGIILMLVSLIFLLLVFSWTSEVPWHLCFAPQIKAKEIPLYHILLWAYVSCCLLIVCWYFFMACMTMR